MPNTQFGLLQLPLQPEVQSICVVASLAFSPGRLGFIRAVATRICKTEQKDHKPKADSATVLTTRRAHTSRVARNAGELEAFQSMGGHMGRKRKHKEPYYNIANLTPNVGSFPENGGTYG